jgi:hypothetical protein
MVVSNETLHLALGRSIDIYGRRKIVGWEWSDIYGLISAAKNLTNGEQVLTMLLDRRGRDVVITEEVLKAIAQNSSKKFIILRLSQQRHDVTITEEVLKCYDLHHDQGWR